LFFFFFVLLHRPSAKALASCFIVCWVVNGQVGQAALGALLATPFTFRSHPAATKCNRPMRRPKAVLTWFGSPKQKQPSTIMAQSGR
jgi:hypothetical protein